MGRGDRGPEAWGLRVSFPKREGNPRLRGQQALREGDEVRCRSGPLTASALAGLSASFSPLSLADRLGACHSSLAGLLSHPGSFLQTAFLFLGCCHSSSRGGHGKEQVDLGVMHACAP